MACGLCLASLAGSSGHSQLPSALGRVIVRASGSQSQLLSLLGIFQARAACRGRELCDLERLNAAGWTNRF